MLLEKRHDLASYVVSATTLAAAACTLPADGFLLNRLRSSSSPLVMDDRDVQALVGWATQHRPQRLAELETLQRTGARLAAALRTKNEVLGVLLFGAPTNRAEYSAVEKRVLGRASDQFALIIENARLTDRVVEQEKLRRDVALAVEVQKRLLPERPPEGKVVTLAAMSVPARSVGGDYYDFIEVGENRIGLALADVAGKGVAAALIMAAVQASLRVIASDDGIPLPELVAKMNRFLHRSTSSASYATFFYAQLDERTRQLRYVNAGHNPPYLVRAVPLDADSPLPSIQELKTGGTVIGLLPDMTYEEATIDLRAGDVFVAFTDGVTEALNANDEEFGEERLKNLICRVAELPVPEISARISEELRGWISNAAQYDDLTFLVMKVNE
jgi:sigma-B regulation protein RsbU (phosphoserine phosphatase)